MPRLSNRLTTMLLATTLYVVMLTGCSDPDTAIRALSGAGYDNIAITGWRATGCSDSDDFATSFSATGPTGVRVTGVVCSGLLKGATIRTD
jgi:hypothetical protein